MTAPYVLSPLAHREPLAAGDQLRLEESAFVALHILRGNPDIIASGCRKELGLDLPTTVGEVNSRGEVHALWLAPDEWLLVSKTDDATDLRTRIEGALNGTHYQLIDVSDYYTGIDVSGVHTRDALAKLMVVDLHPRVLEYGIALATICAKSSVWLWTDPDGNKEERFRLFVRRSHADYLWCLLAEDGREWGMPEQVPTGDVPLHLPHFE